MAFDAGAMPVLGAEGVRPPMDRRRHVLVVEDNEAERDVTRHVLERAGFHTLGAEDAREMFALLDGGTQIDLVLLDLSLPDEDGVFALNRLRAVSDIPVVVVSGRVETTDRVVGLNAGADDYVIKPYHAHELLARVRARLRLNLPVRNLDRSRLVVNPSSVEVLVDDVQLPMTPREYEVLAFLVAHPHQVLSREDLLREVWRTEFADPGLVTEYVRRVRQKLAAAGLHDAIRTRRGLGYQFDANVCLRPEPSP